MSSFICPNCPKLSLICNPVPGSSQIISYLHYLCKPWPRKNYFAHTRKKDLTSLFYYCIIGAGFLLRSCTTAFGADYCLLKKFCATPQKRLDSSRFCTHNGAEQTHFHFVTLLLAPARRPGNVKPHRSGFFRGVFHVKHHSSRSHSRVMSARMPARLSL